MSTKRGIAGILVAAVGVVMIVATFGNDLFSAGPAFEDLTDGFRPQMTEANIQQLEADLAVIAPVADEFETAVAPAIAQRLELTPAEFQAFVGTEYPAVAAGLEALPAVGPGFSGIVAVLDAERERFTSADQIPTANLPATTVPWGFLIIGIAAVVIGAAMVRSRIRMPMLALALGAVMIVGSIVLSLPQKADAADTMNANLQPVYTAELITEARGALNVLGAMGAQMQDEMLPDLATRLALSPQELQGFLGQNFPALAAALTNFGDILARFTTTVNVFDANLPNYLEITGVDLSDLVWLLIAGGTAIVLLGGFALTSAREPSRIAPVKAPRQRKAA